MSDVLLLTLTVPGGAQVDADDMAVQFVDAINAGMGRTGDQMVMVHLWPNPQWLTGKRLPMLLKAIEIVNLGVGDESPAEGADDG